MRTYKLYYFEDNHISKKKELLLHAEDIQKAVEQARAIFSISDYDMKLTEEKRKKEFTSDYTLYKHANKQTYFINEI